MKAALILYLFALSLFLANAQYKVQVTKILTEQVASDGFLILETSGLNLPLRIRSRPNLNQFQLTLASEFNYTEETVSCFVYQFEHPHYSPSKIGCRVRGLLPGRYSINPLSVDLTLEVGYRKTITVLPFNVAGTFEVTEGTELYFYDYDDKDEDFENSYESEDIEFNLFEVASGTEEIYFDDIPVQCYLSLYRMKCNLYPDMFPYERFQTYNVFIKDSEGNLKRNHFVLPVDINMYY